MAIVQNITDLELSIFRVDAPLVFPGDKVTVRDENFVGRAWPKSTWALTKKPALDGYVDASTDDAWLWVEVTTEATPATTDAPADGDPGTTKED